MCEKILEIEEKKIIANYFEFPSRNGSNELKWDLNLVGWCINKLSDRELEIFLLYVQNIREYSYGELIKTLFNSINFFILFLQFLDWRKSLEQNKN